jgi:hypothetical protein
MFNPFPFTTSQQGYDNAKKVCNSKRLEGRVDTSILQLLKDMIQFESKSIAYNTGWNKFIVELENSIIQSIQFSLDVDLLEFVSVPPAPKQIALDDYNLEKYEEAEAYFEMLMQKEQMTALGAYQLMVSDRCINNYGSLGFQTFLSNQAFSLTDRDKLEALLKVNAKEYPQCEGV